MRYNGAMRAHPATAACAALLLGALAARAATVTDTRYFADAPKEVHKDFQGVLTLTLGDPGERAAVQRRLVVREKPSETAPVAVDCKDPSPEPVGLSSGERRLRRAERMECCGMRLIGWTEDDPVERVQLVVTARKKAPGGHWLEVVRDPGADERGWVRYASGGRPSPESPEMDYQWLELWLRSTGFVRRSAARGSPAVLLRAGPYEGAAAAATVPDTSTSRMRFQGVQGAWVRLEIEVPGCRSETDSMEDGSRRVHGRDCPVGWARWRRDSGEVLLFPN